MNNTLIEVKELPSKFLPYGNGKIFYRPYTYGEVDAFSDSNINASKAMDFVLEGIETDGFEKYDLTLGDFLFIALLRKISSFGTLEFQVTSSYRGHPINKVLNHEDIEFDDLEIEALPVVLTLSNVEMHFMPLTVRGYQSLYQREIDNERAALAMQCINMKFDEAYEIINNTTGRDISYLKEVDAMLHHSISPVDVVFTVDGQEVHKSIEIDDPNALVLPFLGSEESTGSPIRFGLQRDS